MRFISFLFDSLFAPRDTARIAREATAADLASLVNVRRRVLDGHDCLTLLPYRHPLVRALVIEAKFADDQHAQKLLAGVLRGHLPSETTLIPLPLGPARRKTRGYNQVERILKETGRAGDMDTDLLERVRETEPQTSQHRFARHRNMEGAFRARHIDPHEPYVLIDDVLTTGASLREAARALAVAGARHIRLIALAH